MYGIAFLPRLLTVVIFRLAQNVGINHFGCYKYYGCDLVIIFIKANHLSL